MHAPKTHALLFQVMNGYDGHLLIKKRQVFTLNPVFHQTKTVFGVEGVSWRAGNKPSSQ